MIKIEEAVIVEGKYDKIRLSGIIDGIIIETEGFGIFSDKEKQALIKELACKTGILILTDSDAAGFKIRNFLCGIIPPKYIKHAYIPDMFGKEKRKEKPSKEGKLGVEGIKNDILLDCLRKAGVKVRINDGRKRLITKVDFYNDGLCGGKNSSCLRNELIKRLDLPSRLTANKLLNVINVYLSYDKYCDLVNEIKAQAEK